MVEVRPFRGIRYNPERIQDLSLVVCPPYDVIDPADQDLYHSLHPWNAIRLDLGKSSGGENRYSRAARLWREWLREGILIEEKKPGYYLLEEEFEETGGTLVVRRGLIALLRLEEGASQRGGVQLHEATHPGPKEDRLALMKATAANLSQIFALYRDPSGALREILESPPPNGSCGEALGQDRVRRRLFFLGDPIAHRQIEVFFSGKGLFIADGHHRYETALAYRAWRRSIESGASEPLPWDYVLAYLAECEDPGLRVYPTHRILWGYPRWDSRLFFSAAERFFEIRTIPWPAPGNRGSACRPMAGRTETADFGNGRPRIRCFVPGRRQGWEFVLKASGGPIEIFPPDMHPLLRSLDVTILHEVLLGRVLGMSAREQETEGYLRYVKGEEAALETLGSEPDAQAAFLLGPPQIRSIMELASLGIRMPQKTTFFYPKLLTGLVFRGMEAVGESLE